VDLPHAALLVTLGAVVGACGTLIGAGGGFLLVPALLLLHPEADATTVTATSLAVVLANAISGSIAYARAKKIDYAVGAVFAAATLPGAIAGVFLVKLVARGWFDIAFGVALLALAGLSLRPPPTTATPRAIAGGRLWERRVVDGAGEAHEYRFDVRLGITISVVVGLLASLLGIGGGIIHVPALVLLLAFPVHVATATSHFTLVFTALVATLVHVVEGDLSAPAVRLELLALIAGVVPGAQLGARWAKSARGTWILRLLAGALALVAVRLFVVGARALGV
jgi:uncharacterized protein